MPRSGLPLAPPPPACFTTANPHFPSTRSLLDLLDTLPPGPLTTCCASSWRGGLDPSEALVPIPMPADDPSPPLLLPPPHRSSYLPVYLQPAGVRASRTCPREKGIRLVTLSVGHTVTPPLPLSPLVAPLPLGLLYCFQQQYIPAWIVSGPLRRWSVRPHWA